MSRDEVDVTVIGAGVVGLAVAAQVAAPGREVLVLERNGSFGQETSSRHSGVIHAGLYYPAGSLKTTLCVRGRQRLYEICAEYGVPHKKTGKLLVAVDESETPRLEKLWQQGLENGVEGLRLLSHRELKAMEPGVEGVAALLSAETGIIDDHSLMRLYLGWARQRGAMVAFQKEVVGIERQGEGYQVTVSEPGGRFALTTRVLVNCAGLQSDRIAEMAGMEIDGLGYRLHYCLGEYFRLARGNGVQRPVYPLPQAAGLGIHVTPDLEGRLRVGPNARYVEEVSYGVDPSQKGAFYQAVRRYLPWVSYEDLEPDFAGVRPKLQGPGEGFRDFVIREEAENGFPGLINLIGIESPGLTASPAIGEMVAGLVGELL